MKQSFCWHCGQSLVNVLGHEVTTTFTDPIGNVHIVHSRCLVDAARSVRASDFLPTDEQGNDEEDFFEPPHKWRNHL